ncbi:hypothetical protein LTR62_006753 [Meristemomyces frigidus]|uniref:Carboxylesterase type B domain-containing protein n=1 Tax=Meristemomyces frigidus TaxID=1508187 RepID=A0AAN7YJ45_9PEZI|nr:hypothetical protein LTR62_006753 [Meristemomyces frigidus]
MSIVSLSTGEPTCTLSDLHDIATANNFTIEPGSQNETAFLLFANAFDATCSSVSALPEYEEPRLSPTPVEGSRSSHTPSTSENPLNAWAQKTTLTAPGAKGPLSGRTIAVKDNVSVAGLPLGLGCSPSLLKDNKHPICPIDATVVKRILAAGGTIKGVATCENLSMFALSFTSDSGLVHNAWLQGYATGGSSSGCAALVSIKDVEQARRDGKLSGADNLGEGVDMAVGGDQGGSIRLPAAYSGIYGLKPTHGLVPYTGIATLVPLIDHTGPMTRTVEDAALMLGVMAGYDGMDPRMTPESPLPAAVPDYHGDLQAWIEQKQKAGEWNPQSAAKGLRVGILKESFEIAGLDPNVATTVLASADRFRTLGAEVTELSIPLHAHAASIWTLAARPFMPHFVAGNPPDILSHTMPHLQPNKIDQAYFTKLANRNPAAVNVLLNAAHMQQKYGPALARKAHMHVWQLRAAYDAVLRDYDVLLTPCNNTVGPPHPPSTLKSESNPDGLSERIMDLFEPAIGNTLNTCGFNVTGHPALSMPVGWGKVRGGEGRLPVGMQVVGKRFDEGSLFKVAKAWENNLNGSDDVNHISAILLDEFAINQASSACNIVNEHLLTESAIQSHYDDFYNQLSYLAYSGRASRNQEYIIQNGVVAFNQQAHCLDFKPRSSNNPCLPVLCTQSANASQPTGSNATAQNEITIQAGSNTFLGYRNLKSWRFSGMPYADPPRRWQYSTVYSGTGQALDATQFGSQCAQVGGGSEDCLFVNVQTPYIPKAGGAKTGLKPVYFWIHGGGFNNGVGSSAGTDGGNLASREDIVVVSINYRLNTAGFFAVPGTNITGNYGIQDQQTALQWTINNIAAFGGDPGQITIIGGSAGAGSVRVHLGSPPVIGKFQGAIAQSNLGGGVDLGLPNNYATSYSSYLTIPENYAQAGQQIFQEANCTRPTLAEQITCLSNIDAVVISELPTVANKVVQDGHYVNTEQLIVSVRNASTAHIPVLFGTAANDGASFDNYPHANNVTSELEGLQIELGISASYAQAIIDSGLFPYYDTGNLTLDSFNVSQRVATDNQFRCIDEATVYAGATSGAFQKAYYYQSQRTLLGYDPNNLGGAPVEPGYPLGDPYAPYFRTHGSDQGWSFGNLPFFRDVYDLYSLQLESSYYAWFAKRGDPNAPLSYLQARGYEVTIQGSRLSGPWEPVKGLQGPIKLLDWPSVTSGFVDVPQCTFLNYTLSYYLTADRG